MNHCLITQTCNYIIVHFSRLTFFLCLRLAGGLSVSADRFGQSPNSIADIVGQDPQDGAMYVSSKLDRFKELAESVFSFHGQKDTIFCTCICRYVRVTVPQSLQELVERMQAPRSLIRLYTRAPR